MEARSLEAVVSANIRALRAAKRMRQDELADAAQAAGRRELSRSAISAIERGARRVSLDDLPALAVALDCTFADLLAGRDGAEARRALGL